jgi:Tol biopolymer transport system component
MSLDRLERRLPEVLTELSLPSVPDYVDTLLSRTERMPQRPGWTFLERWLPVSTFTATLSRGGRLSLRPLIAVAILIAILIATIVFYVGSHPRPAPLTGLARNGVVLTYSQAGDIVSIDPATGNTRTVVHGPNLCCASFSRNGTRMTYLRLPPASINGDPAALIVANADGSTIREITGKPVLGLDSGEMSPSGDQLLLTSGSGETTLIDVATGKETPIPAAGPVKRASWLGTTGDILLTSQVNVENGPGYSYQTLRVARLAAGATNATKLTDIKYIVEPPLVSPDGSKFLYYIWGPELRLQGRIHVFDIATGTDIAVTSEDATEPQHSVEGPQWSADGEHFAAAWFFRGYDQIGITSAATGKTVFAGPRLPENGLAGNPGSKLLFSPDGKSLLVWYGNDKTAWLVPMSGGEGRKVDWVITTDDVDWQRLAP